MAAPVMVQLVASSAALCTTTTTIGLRFRRRHSATPSHLSPLLLHPLRVHRRCRRLPTSGEVSRNGVFPRRRVAATAAAAPWVAAWRAVVRAVTGSGGPRSAISATRKGMQLFAEGDVKGSLKQFDDALDLDPRQLPYLWQRGLSLYYLNRFEDAAAQFRSDVAVNPNDTEESIWCFLCEAQLYGAEEARRRFLVVGPDGRPIMSQIYDVYRYGGSPDDILKAVVEGLKGSDFFYANLYTGLYHEAKENEELAREAILAATQSPYGLRASDYMTAVARVHAWCRGWTTSGA